MKTWTWCALGVAGCSAQTEAAFEQEDLEYEVWVANPASGEVLVIDSTTGATRTAVDSAASAEPFSPSAVAVDEQVLVTDFITGTILSFAAGAEPAVFHENPVSGVQVEEPCAVKVSGDEVFVLGNDTQNLVILDADGEVRAEIGADDPIRYAHGFDLRADGLVVVGTSVYLEDRGLIQLWDRDSGERVGDFGFYPQVVEVTDVLTLPGDETLAADWLAGRLLRYDADGELAEVVARDLDRPMALARAPTGEVLVLTADAVLAVGLDGAVRPLVVDGERLAGARSLWLGPG